MDFELDQEQQDEFLDSVLCCDSQIEFERALSRFADKHGFHIKKVVYARGSEWLRRRAIKRNSYSVVNRISRQGQPFTEIEKRVIDWAFFKDDNEKKDPTVEYIAEMLQRSEAEVEQLKKEAKTKFGVKGFF